MIVGLLIFGYIAWGIGFSMGHDVGDDHGYWQCAEDKLLACEIEEDTKECKDECRGEK